MLREMKETLGEVLGMWNLGKWNIHRYMYWVFKVYVSMYVYLCMFHFPKKQTLWTGLVLGIDDRGLETRSTGDGDGCGTGPGWPSEVGRTDLINKKFIFTLVNRRICRWRKVTSLVSSRLRSCPRLTSRIPPICMFLSPPEGYQVNWNRWWGDYRDSEKIPSWVMTSIFKRRWWSFVYYE